MGRGSVLRSLRCHYCGAKAGTEDHIVPRADLPRPMSRVPYWFRSLDVVPACSACNGAKAWYRSDCSCDHCTWAWNTANNCFLPLGYEPRGWVRLQQDPSLRFDPSTIGLREVVTDVTSRRNRGAATGLI